MHAQFQAGQAEKGSNSAGSDESPDLGDHKEQPIMQPVPQKEGRVWPHVRS